jgi:Predicted pPIWI-associating nuclease
LPSRATAADTQTGLLIAESLTAADLDDGDRDELAEHLSVVTLEAWQTGPADSRGDLFEALAELDPSLPDWLKAAWEDIVRDGPKAASKIANCMIECIDRALRILAPADDVTVWIAQVGAKQSWMDRNRPTRRAKVMFAMHNLSNRDARLAVSQVEALATLVQDVAGNLQSVKHGDAPAMAVMRGWVQAAEGALSQLLLHL